MFPISRHGELRRLQTEIAGAEAASFSKLPALQQAMLTGEGTYCEMEIVEGCFSQFFISPGACQAAWKSCQSLLTVDSTFLKTRFRMTLLAAITLDGNNETLPLAWAIVTGELIEHWSWFIHHLTITILALVTLPSSLVVISNREKGIDHAISQYLPGLFIASVANISL